MIDKKICKKLIEVSRSQGHDFMVYWVAHCPLNLRIPVQELLEFQLSGSPQNYKISGSQPVSTFKDCKLAQELAVKKRRLKKSDLKNTKIAEMLNNLSSI